MKTKLRIETGHPVSRDVEQVHADRIRFVAENGRTMFEVSTGDDGASIEVRAVETCRVGGVLYSGLLEIVPRCANAVRIKCQEYP